MVLVHVIDGSVGVADSDIEAHRFCVQQQRMDEEINTTRMQTGKNINLNYYRKSRKGFYK